MPSEIYERSADTPTGLVAYYPTEGLLGSCLVWISSSHLLIGRAFGG